MFFVSARVEVPARATQRMAAVATLALASACGRGTDAPPADAQVWFEEVSSRWGLDFEHQRGPERYWFPEIMGGGVALLDFDGDGRQDVYFVQSGDLTGGGPGNRLFRNVADGRFDDVTDAAGTGDEGYGMGCAVGDYDGDGDADLYVTNVGANVLYRNEGDGTFTDVTAAAGVAGDAWSASAAFFDSDSDGDLDLFVVNYVDWSLEQEIECRAAGDRDTRDYCPPATYRAPAPDSLFENRGDGSFADVTRAQGIDSAFGNGLGVAVGDFDGDGRTDVYVANDGMANQLWIRTGGGFEDRALYSGCALNESGRAEAGMGVAAVDVEDDGDLDLFVTHLREESNTLYRNRDGLFDDITAESGLALASLPYTGFGLAFADFDNDGDQDLYVANGRVLLASPLPDAEHPYREANSMWTNTETRFREVTPSGGTGTELVAASRALAAGDLDGDGGVDLVIVNQNGRAHVLRNARARRGHWLVLRILDAAGADAIGARVGARVGPGTQWRWVQPAASYQSSSDARVHFGLGPATEAEEVQVIWPDGHRGTFERLAADRVHVLRR